MFQAAACTEPAKGRGCRHKSSRTTLSLKLSAAAATQGLRTQVPDSKQRTDGTSQVPPLPAPGQSHKGWPPKGSSQWRRQGSAERRKPIAQEGYHSLCPSTLTSFCDLCSLLSRLAARSTQQQNTLSGLLVCKTTVCKARTATAEESVLKSLC